MLPTDAKERKTYPLYRGLIKYFPNALCEVAHCSWEGNQQHHPDKPLHWDMNKSTDEADALLRHLVEGEYVQVAWRALALLERHLTGKLDEQHIGAVLTNTDYIGAARESVKGTEADIDDSMMHQYMYKPKIYIAGPMRAHGIEGLYNFPEFDKAAIRLRRLGWDVVNPAEEDRKTGFDPSLGEDYTEEWLEERMAEDLRMLKTCDAIYMLRGWQDSEGSNDERDTARNHGLRVYYQIDCPPKGTLPRPVYKDVRYP